MPQRIVVEPGTRYGHWVVIGEAPRRPVGVKKTAWLRCVRVRCDCGTDATVFLGPLRSGQTTRCQRCGYSGIRREWWHRHRSKFRSNARSHGHEFALEPEEFRILITSPCHYCGAPPEGRTAWKGSSENRTRVRQIVEANGLDRVDCSKGYIRENCVPCCVRCNLAKNKWSAEEFVNHCRRVARHQDLDVRCRNP